MTRTFALAAVLAAGMTAPVMACDQAADAAGAPSSTARQAAMANQTQMRAFLAAQGYIVTSELKRDAAGRWVGSALKDGKTVGLAVKMPPRTPAATVTN